MIAIALLLAVSAVVAAAQKPKVSNAKLQELSAGGNLKATVDGLIQKQAGPLWIGYRIPTAAKERTLCCFESVDQFKNSDKCCMGCRMESEKGGSFNGTVSDCSPPEPLPYAFVFLRADGGQIGKVRVYSADCALEFANLPLYWLEDVKPEQSVDLLTGLALVPDAGDSYGKKASHQAIMAIAMHDTPAADAALEKLIQPNQREPLRENVAFWLGVERGKKGVELLHKYVKEDPDDNVRTKGTFAFSQSKEPEALKDLIDMARHDQSPWGRRPP
jgi:hypothetical protein